MKSVHEFYNTVGWKKNNKQYKDAKISEDLRFFSREYLSKCRKRILRYIPRKGVNMLDFASGPIQYNEYLSYSKNYNYRHCVDFSKDAIKFAKLKLRQNGKFYCQDFLGIKFKNNYFDCILSIHTIYHIKKQNQKKAILKLLDISKKNSPIIIIYSNPNTIISRIKRIVSFKSTSKKVLYFHCFKNEWWNQFKGIAEIKMYPWRSFSSGHQKILFPNNEIGKIMFRILFSLYLAFIDISF